MFNQYRRSRKRTKNLILVGFFIIVCSVSIGYSLLKQDVKIVGKSTIQLQDEELQDYIVTYVIDSKWYSNGRYYYKIIMTLLNNTNETLDGWKISINSPEDVILLNYSNVNARVIDAIIEFENVSYNAQIPSKQTVDFEFQLSTTDSNYSPGNIIVNGTVPIPPIEPDKPEEDKKAEVELKYDYGWQSGIHYFYQYIVNVKNVGKSTINSWQFDIELENTTIDQIWGANYTSQNTVFTFNNLVYNGIIEQNGSVSFGFIVKTLTENIILIPTNIVLK